MIKSIAAILFIALILIACSEPVQQLDIIDVSHIYQSRDSLAFSELINEKHFLVRRELLSHLSNYLYSRRDSSQAIVDSIFAEANWLIPIYTSLTNCTDMFERFKLYRNWSNCQLFARFTLDSNIRNILKSSGTVELDTTLENFDKLKLQYESLGDLFRTAYISYKQAEMCYNNNKLALALPYLKQAVSACQTVNDYDHESRVQLLLSKFYTNCELDYHRAEIALSRGFECIEQTDNYPMLAYYHKYQAYNFLMSFETRKALAGFSNALEAFSKARSEEGVAECNYFIGETYYYMNKYDSAAYFGNKALEQRRELVAKQPKLMPKLIPKIGISLSNIGMYMAALGDTALALARFDEAEAILEDSQDEKAICMNRIHKALVLVKLDRIGEGRELLNYALNHAERFEDRTMTLFGLALCDYYENKQSAAISKLRLCIYRLESSRNNIPVTDYKIGMLSDKIGFYHLISNIFINRFTSSANQSELDSAFFYLERSKAKTLNDMLVTSEAIDSTSEPLYDSLIALISHYENKLLTESNVEPSLRTEIQQLERLLHKFRIENTELSSVTQPDLNYDFPTLHEVQQTIESDEILLEYMISEFGSYVFAIDKESIEIVNLSMEARDISDLTGQYCNAINERPRSNRMPDSCIEKGKELYSTLFPSKLESQIEGKHITIIASDRLHYLPFESLIDNSGQFMVENYDISYIPSMTIRNQLARRKLEPSLNVYVFGNPLYTTPNLDPLPFSDDEVDCIVDIFGRRHTKVFKGIEATETEFRNIDFSNASILHIATHGITDELRPGKSALIFASGETDEGHSMLHSEEIARLNIPVDLVFLSACRSGTGGAFPGEGVLSLCQPFLVAGSNSVIASYWNINDRCSVEMVKNFYNYRIKGLSKAKSLARAKRDLLHHKRTAWNHPYYWASLVLIGLDN